MSILVLAASMALVVPVSAADAKAPQKDHANKLLGTWLVVSGETEGKPAPPEKPTSRRATPCLLRIALRHLRGSPYR